jgi:hypothetical protein
LNLQLQRQRSASAEPLRFEMCQCLVCRGLFVHESISSSETCPFKTFPLMTLAIGNQGTSSKLVKFGFLTDFCQYSAENGVFLENHVMIKFLQKLAVI